MNRLKQLRIEKRVTQSDVANYLNVTRQGYANYENEITNPTPAILIRLADYFECSIDYLLGRESDIGSIVINQGLNEKESELLRIYRNQSDEKKNYLLTFAKGLDEKF
ncbi:MAG: helix-turn-helix transcriptional regulator [Clostridia bacterium]|nr:helix-turn-helix transcriptional regulator [Clostridia bacterium]